jgi:hypothetical protein
MDSDEREIFDYLKSWADQFVSGREICRRAGGRRKWAEDPNWALPLLNNMVEKGILESDSKLRYRLKSEDKKKKQKHWLSPDIAKIFEKHGVNPDKAVDLEAEPKPSGTPDAKKSGQ